MRQQENKKENFRENPTKLTWIPKVYNYAERTGNLKAEAVGVVSGEKHSRGLKTGWCLNHSQNQSHSLPHCLPVQKYSGPG